MIRLPRLALVSTLVSSLILSLVVAGSVMAGGKPLLATLVPGEEPTGGDANAAAIGHFAMTLNYGQGEVCYWLSYEGLTGPATNAHVHVAPVGVAGGVVIPLAFAAASSGSTSACVAVDGTLIKAIIQNPSAYYVNVHTELRPAGAIRGQLTEPED
jgi:hypothetical protein